jgi:tRNA (cytidine/uridine-2'-O-)-methyltransferase
MAINVVLYQTDIAQNVGSIIRTSVAFGVNVHIVEPLGFVWDEPKMRRAGMDYLDRAKLTRHKSWQMFLENEQPERLVLLTTKGAVPLDDFAPKDGDYYVFGRESAGVPDDVHARADERVLIPMVAGERSINIAQSVAITMYNALSKTAQLPK